MALLSPGHPIFGFGQDRIQQRHGVLLHPLNIEAAREAYKSKHPDWRLQQYIVLPVGYPTDHPLIETLEMIESGKWPPK